MRDYDYILGVNEDGQTYLAHALFGGRGGQKGSQKDNHKYYTRVEEKGKWRYFYSPEEYKAWASGAVNKAKTAAGNAASAVGNKARAAGQKISDTYREVTGVGAKDRMNAARRDVGRAKLREMAAAGRARTAEMHNQADAARMKDAYDELAKANAKANSSNIFENNIFNKKKNKEARAAAADKALRSSNRYNASANAMGDAHYDLDDAREASAGARSAYNRARDEYESSIAGRAASAGASARNAANSAKNKISSLADAAKEFGSQKLSDLRGTADDALESVRNAGGRAADKVKQGARSARDAADDMLDRAEDKVKQGARSARDAARNTADDVADRVREAGERAADYARDKAGYTDRDATEAARKETRYAQNRVEANEEAVATWTRYRQESAKELAAAVGKRDQSAREYKEHINKIGALFTPGKNKELRERYEEAQREVDRALEQYESDSYGSEANSRRLNKARADLEAAEADYAAADAKYRRTVVGKIDKAVQTIRDTPDKVKEITEAQAKKLQSQISAGKELAQDEMNQLMSFLFKQK